jgi:hypothetical protein
MVEQLEKQMINKLAQSIVKNILDHIDFDLQITEETINLSVKYKGVIVLQKTINYKLQNYV